MAIARTSKRRKGVQKTERDFSRLPYKIVVGVLALGFGVLHHQHVSSLFENARHFSHLSEIEREMSFRTEMGMYYMYYKQIAESKTLMDGLKRIKNDNLSEYPNVFDAEAKYSLFPEMVAGYCYHAAKSLGILKQQCWQIERGEGPSPVTSCGGLGVPVYFYLEVVWCFANLTGVVMFLYATYLSGTIYGGIIAILSFFYNHTECTRVQWTPPLRESFAYPALLYQMYRITMIIDKYQTKSGKDDLAWREILINGRYIDLLVITAVSLLSWQFSQFVLMTQLIALTILQWMGIIPRDLYTKLSALHAIPVITVIFGTRSSLLLCSMYTCFLVGSNYSNNMNRWNWQSGGVRNSRILVLCEIVGTIGITVLLKTAAAAFDDDQHIFNLLRSKLTKYKDFHTLLYTCSPEFDFMQYETYEAIVSTLLLPTAILAGILVIYYWYRNYRIVGYPDCIEAAVAYNGLQTFAFIIMAFFIMRLKLFMTPQLCIIAGLAASKRYLVGVKTENVRVAVIVLLIAGMSYHGIQRLDEEDDFIGEYSNIDQEELFEWIKANTPKTAAFAGKMSLMANLMLSTERPIVNNPYYENKKMRDRTLKVYEIYSRKDASTVYDTLRKMQVDYVVIEEGLCYGLGNAPPGCRMVDLWDVHDNETSKRDGKRPLCPILFRGNAHPFRRVFVNRKYVVLRLDYSTYVELKPSAPVLFQSW